MRAVARERWARTPAANPLLLLRQFLVEGRALLFLRLQDILLADQVGVVVAGPADQVAPVELNDARGDLAQESAVVGDEEKSRLLFQEDPFQPQDRFEIEVVGRLVKQQQVRLARERPGQQRAALEASGKLREAAPRLEAGVADQILDPDVPLPVLLVTVVVGPQPACDNVVHTALEIGRNLLCQPGKNRARRAEHFARVGLHIAHDDLHQGRLSRAVAPDQADPLARFELEIDLVEDRRSAEVQRKIEEREEGRHVEPARLGQGPAPRKPRRIRLCLELKILLGLPTPVGAGLTARRSSLSRRTGAV